MVLSALRTYLGSFHFAFDLGLLGETLFISLAVLT